MADTPSLVVNLDEHTVTFDGQETPTLTAGQMTLLATLARHPRRVFTHGELLDTLWQTSECTSNIVPTHLSQVRARLGKPVGWLESVPGVGYRLAPKDAVVEVVERSDV